MSEPHFARPPKLSPGDPVAVVAPSGPVRRERFQEGAAILGARYRLVHEERLFATRGFLAGDDDARARELAAALADPTIKAVMCARGGYGLMRILARLDARAYAAAPKLVIGFSDATALLAWSLRAKVGAVHGPVLTQLGRLPAGDQAALFALVEGALPPPLTGLRALAPGRARGPLVGGNLELLSRLIGTPFAAPLDGAILLLEDVGERPYRLDRALTQMLLAGALARIRGVVLGDFRDCDEPPDPNAAGDIPKPEEIVRERLSALGVPIAAGAPIGHAGRNRAVPLGAQVTLDAGAGTLEFHEPAAE